MNASRLRRSTLVRLVLLAALVLAALTFGSCARRADAADGTVVVRFWNGFSGPDGETMRGIVRAFNAEQEAVRRRALAEGRPAPETIRVEMEIIPWGTFYDKTTLGLAFGGAPDLFVLHTGRFPEYASHGVLSPIDDDLRAAGLGPDKYPAQTWAAATWEGRQYALPLDIHPMTLYYNLDLFERAGIAKPPATWEEFVDAARRLKVDRNGDGKPEQWGFAFTYLPSNSQLFFEQFGGSMLTPDLQRSAMGSPQVRAALDRMNEIVYEERLAPVPKDQDAWLGFRTGKVAMAMEGVYMMAELEKQEGLRYAAAPVPQFGPVRAVQGGSHLLTMPRENDPRRRAAAWTFALYLSNHSIAWAKGGQVPARRDLVASPEFQSLRVQSVVATQLDHLVYDPASVSLNLIATFKDSAVEKVLNRLAPEEEAIADAERRMNAVLDRQKGAR